ncbi:MAG: AbrB/MazE/SpoVT family DNA-binding domain-containing protein [Candidatus Nanohaloarchaea archaeon]
MDTFTFLAALDSKGRLTVPAKLRDRYGLAKGDTFRVSIDSVEVERIAVDGPEEARQVLDEFDDIESFSYRDGVLEVVRGAEG